MEDERVGVTNLRKFMCTAAISALIGFSGTSSAYAECEKTVRIAENDWTGQLIDVHLARIIMTEHLGIDAEAVFADYSAQWVGLANGDLDIGMEVWPSFSLDAHNEWIDEKKKVVKVGDLGVLGESGWYVPTYLIKGDAERGIEAMAPELKTWEDIEQYADLFKRPETGDKIFCIDAVESWDIKNEGRIEALGLNMVNVYAGTEGALIAEIEGAYARGEPLFICDMWKPHWVHAKYDLTEIELPAYSDECYGVGGLEPGDFGCDFPDEMTYNIARAGFEEECPTAYKLIENMWLSSEHQQNMTFMVEVEGVELEAAIKAWMADNEDVWRKWLP